MWDIFKARVKRVMESPPFSPDDLAREIAQAYDTLLKTPPSGDLMNKNPVQAGNVQALELKIKSVLLQQEASNEQLDIINAIANGFIQYWAGATLQPLYPPLLPVPGAISNIIPVQQVLVTRTGIQTTIAFTYEGLDNVDGFIDKLILAANVHLQTVGGEIFTTAIFPGGITAVGVGTWTGYSATGNAFDLSGIPLNAFQTDPNKLADLKRKFGFLVNPAELDQALQDFADTQKANLSEIAGGTGGEAGDISSVDLSGEWVKIAAQYISKNEGFTEISSWDVNAYRLGFGTDKILLDDGTIKRVLPVADYYKQTNQKKVPPPIGMRTTRANAMKMLEHDLVNRFKPRVVGTFGNTLTEEEWNKLSEPAKAALISYAYNCGSLRTKIASAIKEGKYDLAGQYIKEGPTTGGGVVYPGLVRRRAEESALFLSQPLPIQIPTDITAGVASTNTTTNRNTAG